MAQSVARLAQLALHLFGISLLFGIAGDERLEIADRGARLGLVALRRPHLAEVRHAQLVLRVVGARVRGVEGQELLELVDGQHEASDVLSPRYVSPMASLASGRRGLWV